MAYTTINKSTDYFNTKLYTGNGSTNAISSVGHQPDLVWLKERSSAGAGLLFDAVRTATKFVRSSDNAAEVTAADTLTAFNSDGFTLGADAGNYAANQNSETYVAWNWKAGTTSGITTTNSTITPSGYSFNQTAGFSIIKYPGNSSIARCPHGLGVAPKMIFIKDLGDTNNWQVYNASIGNTKMLELNTTVAQESTSARWNNTSPDSVNWTMGTTGAVNGNGANYIAYCFAEKTGYSKISSYTGNGNADGAFIYTGFKPAWILIKKTSGAASWYLHDNRRSSAGGFNVSNEYLRANLSNATGTDQNGGDFCQFHVRLTNCTQGCLLCRC